MSEKQIVLVGVGHTNAHILDRWRRSPIPGARLVCVSNFAVATYSGMLPGSLTGQYPPHRMEIDLASLARAARTELVVEPARYIDVENRKVHFESARPVPFDVLSIGVGSVPAMNGVRLLGGAFVPIKPMQSFLMRLYERIGTLAQQRRRDGVRVTVAGGGVGGIELTLCLPSYLGRIAGGPPRTIALVDAHDHIGSGLSPRAVRKVESLLGQRAVHVITGTKVAGVTDEEVYLDDGSRMAADAVVWAAGAAAPPLVNNIALPKDPQGFLLTRDTLQSTGADDVFAVGDTGTVEGHNLPKAGVHAVREGPVLWRNIRSLLRGRPLRRYAPQADFLRLLNTGDGKALMDYKGWALHARWCWFLKDWIDTRFVSRFRVTRN